MRITSAGSSCGSATTTALPLSSAKAGCVARSSPTDCGFNGHMYYLLLRDLGERTRFIDHMKQTGHTVRVPLCAAALVAKRSTGGARQRRAARDRRRRRPARASAAVARPRGAHREGDRRRRAFLWAASLSGLHAMQLGESSSVVLVTGGAGYIGGNFVLAAVGRRSPRRQPRRAHLRGQPRNAGIGAVRIRIIGSCTAISADRRLVEQLLAEHRPRAIVNFAAESHVDRSIDGPAAFIQTNVVGTLVLLEAARDYWKSLPEAAHVRVPLPACLDGRGVRFARRRALHGELALRAELAVLGLEGRVGPPGACIPPDLWAAGADHALLEQLRSVPVPGQAHSADDPQGAGRGTDAGLRRRRKRPGLALRRRSLRGTRAGPRTRGRWARPTTSAATQSCETSTSYARSAGLSTGARHERDGPSA